MAQYNHSVVMHLGGINKWIIDTGATDHVTSDPRVFDELCDYVRDSYITSANRAPSHVKGECTISLTQPYHWSVLYLFLMLSVIFCWLENFLIPYIVQLTSTLRIVIFKTFKLRR
ncbi:hypothetical protein PS2_024179 [Malus domestica]